MGSTLAFSGTVKADAPAGGFAVDEIVAGRYRLLARLGEGAYGQVFKACHMDVPEHRVALKIMGGRSFSARDADQEMRRLAAVAHPNVVQLADHGLVFDEHGAISHVWFTMPLYEGTTLRQRIAGGPLSLREAHAVFVPIARGLAAMHDAGLRHQDVKPDNLF